MTSLKKHIDACEQGIASAALSAYCRAAACLGQNAERALPGIKSALRIRLGELAQRLRTDTTPAVIEEVQHRFEIEVRKWADSIVEDLQEKTLEVKGMMLTLATAAERVALRDSRASTQFNELTVRLQSAGRLEDISAIRLQLTASVTELKANIHRMENEGRATVQDLKLQVETWRAQAAESERRASTDSLTGLKNRRGVGLAFDSFQERRSPFSLILLDLNGFKEINDKHGHLVGDELLKHFASELREQCRPADVVGRWGGDEFIVITNLLANGLEIWINSLRRWVLGTYKVNTPAGTLRIPVNAAIGIAVWDRQEDLDRLLSRADTLMYAEKRVRA